MRLDELLPQDRIHVPLPAGSVEEGLALLLQAFGGGDPQVDRRRISPTTLVALVPTSQEEETSAALGVAPDALTEPEGEEEEESGPRILIVLRSGLSPEKEKTLLDRLIGVLDDPDVEARLLGASGPEEIRALDSLMDHELTEPLRVEDVLVPLGYRVFPDTPLTEVVDLMARRGLRALPVVGEDLQLLGIVTAREALRHAMVQRARKKKDEDEEDRTAATARDVMSRSVMCVSGEQDLLDAAQLMVNKDVGQLPVVREGEIVGVLTRDAVLTALFSSH